VKVIQISDLHTKGLGRIEEKFLTVINNEKPEYVFITGDIATPGGTNTGYENLLKKIKAKNKVFYIPGNWEDWEPIPDLQNILKRNGIINLTNKTIKLDENLWLVGFADAPTGNPDLKILDNIPKNSKIISIFHSPIFFNEVSNLIDFAFVGHTHGGQIRLPFLGAIALPPGSENFDQGWFLKNRAKMYVNRGIGTSIVPLRFLCRPEISVFEIKY
jgi:predicted MPP superfamily phosphohydrolase